MITVIFAQHPRHSYCVPQAVMAGDRRGSPARLGTHASGPDNVTSVHRSGRAGDAEVADAS